MRRETYTLLQLREAFHFEFLRWFGRRIKGDCYALKGGVNLRFFFNSFRYSEDIDLDIRAVKVEVLRDEVMKILQSISFQDGLKPFGIEKIIPPDITKAKQTQTTQRFKVHLITSANEDLFTKIEFSRRGFKGRVIIQPISNLILRLYKLSPLAAPHYCLQSAIIHKIEALSMRAVTQARDIFDLYILIPQYQLFTEEKFKMDESKFEKARENIFEISFEQFRDTVVSYLSAQDRLVYDSSSLWDEIKLKTVNFIEEVQKNYV